MSRTAVDIIWDTDGIPTDLPRAINIPEEITDEDEISDYISDLTGYCHQGFELRWNAPYWVFPEENAEQVKALLMEIYAEDGTPQDTVDVMVNISALEDDDVLSLCGRILCSRRYRDGAVKLGSGVMLMQGGFPTRGGSSKYPRVAPEEGTVLKVKNVPVSVYERIKKEMPNVTLADDSDNKRALHKKRLPYKTRG